MERQNFDFINDNPNYIREPEFISELAKSPARRFNQLENFERTAVFENSTDEDFENTFEEHGDNYNERSPRRKKTLRNIAKLALGATLVGGAIAGYRDYTEKNSTIDDRISQVDMHDSSTFDLDTTPDNLDEYQKIADTAENSYQVTLKAGETIRTNNADYRKSFDPEANPTHNAIATTQEDVTFNLNKGEIYQTPDGEVVARAENFATDAQNRKTGIKTEVDSDGWLKLDVSAKDLKVVETE
ncbi:MAG: hypothetical protein Q4A27_03120 [bacterium]|nr:hypothetical protein [bacterium]